MPPGARPLTVGDPVVVGRYLLLGRLGMGGMGVVYLAEHPRGGVVALKTPHPAHLGDATLRARFAEEVRFSRRVVPFCTAAVVEDGTDGDRPYLVSEYVPGPALSQVVSTHGPLTPDLAYGVALGVAGALVAVHEAGLVHRDLKPANVLLSHTGPRVIDFGIARDVDVHGAHTQAGQVMGSPGWVAPERLTGGLALPASDVFAWGCLIAYAATGHHPFGAGEADTLTRRILVEPPRTASVPALLRPAVEASLAKDPAHRPGAADLLGALLAAGGVGDPWDPREAVAEVLAEIWTPVPYAPGAGRVRLAAGAATPEPPEPPELPVPPAPSLSSVSSSPSLSAWSSPVSPPSPAGHPSSLHDEPSVPAAVARRPRRAGARGRAHLPQAGFAALATISMAAVTVVAAAGGGGAGSPGGLAAPERVPVVVPAETPSGPVLPGRTRPPAGRTRTPSPAPPSTARVTATRTVPPAGEEGVDGEDGGGSGERPPERPRGPGGPRGDGGPPRDCADTTARGRGGPRGCPTGTSGPRPSFTQIPQTGDGESPSPTPTAPAPSGTTITPVPTPGPSLQIG
ncbi:serine/threonine-protein kinase [Streptosporangium sp. NPDC023615]|uniref:serine/threonine-protein kinase n=1 Tax=Streptosporangium sp. NPDC023615 TaxID=3154794 RepID=UPI00343A2B5A